MRTTGTATSPIAWPEETRGSAPWPDAARQVSPTARKQLRATPTAYATEGVFDRVEVREAMQVFPAEE